MKSADDNSYRYHATGLPAGGGRNSNVAEPLRSILNSFSGTAMPRIDTNISDLFFNTDLDECKLTDLRGQFVGYDETRLRREAEIFLGCLSRLNVAVPSIDDLLADFDRRL